MLLGLDQLAQGSIGGGRVCMGGHAIGSAHSSLAGAVLQEKAGSLQVAG